MYDVCCNCTTVASLWGHRNKPWAGLAICILTVLIVTFKYTSERKYANVAMFSAIKWYMVIVKLMLMKNLMH